VLGIRLHLNEKLAGRAIDLLAQIKTGLNPKITVYSLMEMHGRKANSPKYTASELIVNNAKNFGNLPKNRS
jgi:hypothetical protein